MIKLILFDLDGTLIHFREEGIVELVKTAFNKFAKKISKKDAIDFWFNHERIKYIEEKNLDEGEFWKYFHSIDTPKSRAKYSSLYNDVNVLGRLNGARMGIVTTAAPDIAKYEVGLVEEIRKMDKVVIANEYFTGIKGKPDPEGINLMLNDLKVYKEYAIIIGDTDADILAGRNAGIRTCHIDRGYKIKEKPDYSLNSLNSLKYLLSIIT